MFIKTNLNPTGKATSDCVVRAIMKANQMTWTDVMQALCRIAWAEYKMPNSKEVYGEYLKQLGWKKQSMPKTEISNMIMKNGIKTWGKTYRRYTVERFAKENPKGTYIISVANHLTCLVDGNLFDTWDCSYKSMNNYWIK